MENISYIELKVQCMHIMTKTDNKSQKRRKNLRIHKRGGGTCGQWLFPTYYSSPNNPISSTRGYSPKWCVR
jgi:hypothetical protein